jgi:hypothetical protein
MGSDQVNRLMKRAMEQPSTEETATVRIPRPYPGATYTIQSLGRFVDRLTGDTKARDYAAEQLEPLLVRDDGESDPEPAEVPEPTPGESEPITKGDDPAGERR